MRTQVKRATLTLSDLRGLPKGLHEAVVARSRTDALTLLRAGKIVTASGSFGALNIWRDSRGLLHCEFFRWCITVNLLTCKALRDVRTWLAEWWPQLSAATPTRNGGES